MKNLKWPKELGFELFILLHPNVFPIKLNFFTWCETAKLHALIVGSFLQFLSVEQVLPTKWYQFFQLFYCFVSKAGSQIRANFILKQYIKMIAPSLARKTLIQLEKRMTDTCILSIVILKFSLIQKSYQIVLFLIENSTWINFHCAILSLGFGWPSTNKM